MWAQNSSAYQDIILHSGVAVGRRGGNSLVAVTGSSGSVVILGGTKIIGHLGVKLLGGLLGGARAAAPALSAGTTGTLAGFGDGVLIRGSRFGLSLRLGSTFGERLRLGDDARSLGSTDDNLDLDGKVRTLCLEDRMMGATIP